MESAMGGNAAPIRHGRARRPARWKALLKALSISIAVVLVSATAVAGTTAWQLGAELSADAVDLSAGSDAPPLPAIKAYGGGFNILVVGVDNSSDQSAQYGKRTGTLNDVNLVLHVSADHSSAVAVSFPRDLVIPHPSCEDPESGKSFSAMSAQPLNAAMGRGGLGCVAKTIENLTGLDIPYAATMNFNAVKEVTDAIGGVSVCLTAPLRDRYVPINLPAGYSEISGEEALGFLRSRHGVGDGSDLSRISSQQQYMSSLVRKLKSAETLTNISAIYGIAQVVKDNVQLSTTLASIDTMVSMAQAFSRIDLGKVTFVQYPTGSDVRYPGKVVPQKRAATELFDKIIADEPFALPEDSTGRGSVDVSTEPTTTPAPEAAPTPTDTPSPTDTVAPPPPSVVDGLKGSTAEQETCAVPFGQ